MEGLGSHSNETRMLRDHHHHRPYVLTKGDNIDIIDEALYPPGQELVYRSQIIGVV